MNFTKKNYKIFVFLIGIILIIIGSCIIMFHKPIGKCEIITVTNDYYVVNSDFNNYLNIPIYFSIKDPIFIDQNQIDSIFLINESGEDIIPLSIFEINYLNEVKVKEVVYYQYDLKVKVDLELDFLTIYDSIYLGIDYNTGPKIKMLIGSLCIYNYIQNNDIHYTSLKGIVEEFENKKMLKCILVKLNTTKPIEII